jgi:hypothetical protein
MKSRDLNHRVKRLETLIKILNKMILVKIINKMKIKLLNLKMKITRSEKK